MKNRWVLTFFCYLIAISSGFAPLITNESGWYYDGALPVGQRCVNPKTCQSDDPTKPLCQVVVDNEIKTLFRKTALDACQTTVLFEIESE